MPVAFLMVGGNMKIALKLLFWYLAASLLATSLSLVLEPSHAHIPSLVILVLAPMHPPMWITDLLDGRLSIVNAIALGLFVTAFGFGIWQSLRRRAAEGPAAESTPLGPAIASTPLSAELIAYFERTAQGAYAGLERLDLNFLSQAASADATASLRFHPLVRQLEGVVLDDPNTSNHHLYLSRQPFTGSVFYLSHDGDSRVVFSSLDDFVAAADMTRQKNGCLSDLHPACSPLVQDQDHLSRFVNALADSGTDDDEMVLHAVIPSMDLSDLALLERLALNENHMGETIAMEIEKRPSTRLGRIAELCSHHPAQQVARAGTRAMRAIAGLA